MLLKTLGWMIRRRPLLGIQLLRDAVCDWLGCHRESNEAHLLDVLRFGARAGARLSIDAGDHLMMEFPSGSLVSRIRLRMGDSDIRVFREVIVHDGYREALAKFGRGRAKPWIVDAGANVGLTTLYFKHYFPDARVVALEPDRGNRDQMLWHLANNSCDDVRVVEAALWPVSARLRFVGAGNPGPSWGLRVEVCDDGPIQAISPMELLRDHAIDQIDLLKLDVEGSEYPLLTHPDAGLWLARVRAIIMEVHPEFGDPSQITDVLLRAGFEIHDLGGNIFLAERTA